jgi:uncharacterized protein (UPF0210 family)
LHLGLIKYESVRSKIEGLGFTLESITEQYTEEFQSVVESYKEQLVESTVNKVESKFSQVEGMDDEIGIEIVNYFRDNFESGPSFH